MAALGGKGDGQQCNTAGRGREPSLLSREVLAGCGTQSGRCSGRGDSAARPVSSSTSLLLRRHHHLFTGSCYCSCACHVSLLKHLRKAIRYLEGF